jgi:hypothetical protein
VSFLKDADSKLVIAGLGTLAVLGSFLIWAIFFGVFAAGFGMNEDLAFGLSFLAWLATVVVMIFGVVSFYNNSIKNRVEQVTVNNTVERVTVIREVVAPPVVVEVPGAVVETRQFLDEPQPSSSPSISHHPMLTEGDILVDPEPRRFSDEPERSSTPSPSYRSILSEETKDEDDLK